MKWGFLMITTYRVRVDTTNSDYNSEYEFAAFTKDVGKALELFIERQRTIKRKTPNILSITRLSSYDLLQEQEGGF